MTETQTTKTPPPQKDSPHKDVTLILGHNKIRSQVSFLLLLQTFITK